MKASVFNVVFMKTFGKYYFKKIQALATCKLMVLNLGSKLKSACYLGMKPDNFVGIY